MVLYLKIAETFLRWYLKIAHNFPKDALKYSTTIFRDGTLKHPAKTFPDDTLK
jgi:hypothetical protein